MKASSANSCLTDAGYLTVRLPMLRHGFCNKQQDRATIISSSSRTITRPSSFVYGMKVFQPVPKRNNSWRTSSAANALLCHEEGFIQKGEKVKLFVIGFLWDSWPTAPSRVLFFILYFFALTHCCCLTPIVLDV